MIENGTSTANVFLLIFKTGTNQDKTALKRCKSLAPNAVVSFNKSFFVSVFYVRFAYNNIVIGLRSQKFITRL